MIRSRLDDIYVLISTLYYYISLQKVLQNKRIREINTIDMFVLTQLLSICANDVIRLNPPENWVFHAGLKSISYETSGLTFKLSPFIFRVIYVIRYSLKSGFSVPCNLNGIRYISNLVVLNNFQIKYIGGRHFGNNFFTSFWSWINNITWIKYNNDSLWKNRKHLLPQQYFVVTHLKV